MEMNEQCAVPVRETSQVGEARRSAAALAASAGFDEVDAGKIAIVVTEAATNLVKHARAGEIVLGVGGRNGGGRAMMMLALDRGPGIPNVAASMRDGVSTAGSPGTGLGAIARLATGFDLYSAPAGTALFATIGGDPGKLAATKLQAGVVSVPKRGEQVCGDGAAVVDDGRRCAVLVVDGLGHGAGAAEAAIIAMRIFRAEAAKAPVDIMNALHHGLRGTRGAAGAVAVLERANRLIRFVGIGNIAGVVQDGTSTRNMVSHYGTLGHEVRKVQEFTYPWSETAIVALHSDGISSRWDLARYPGLMQRHAMTIAGVLYRDFRRERDDATVVVLREPR